MLDFPQFLLDQSGRILTDYRTFYGPANALWLAAGIGLGAVMANTNFDSYLLEDLYRENVVLTRSREWVEVFHQPKLFGEGLYVFPAFALAALAEPLLLRLQIADVEVGDLVGNWGRRSLRTVFVGGPLLLGLQALTGASRPGESSSGSHWEPFVDVNGVSGHAFMGAIPFLTAAGMTDNPWLQTGCVVASTLPGLSRLNDSSHYLSQVFLGWWIAYLAARTVHYTDEGLPHLHLFPAVTADGWMLVAEQRF